MFEEEFLLDKLTGVRSMLISRDIEVDPRALYALDDIINALSDIYKKKE